MSKYSVLFSGQGSQKIGMLSNLAKEYDLVRETFDEAADALNYNLWNLIQNGPKETLNQTSFTQPALLTASVSIWRVWRKNFYHKQPSSLAGHSLGEYSALVCANVINFNEAVKLVKLRGYLMQEAMSGKNIGAMCAIIGLNENFIQKICKEAQKNDEIVSPANFNSPDQIVISGHKNSVERAEILCKKAGAKRTVMLSVSVPSHCMLMKSAADKLALNLEKINFQSPTIPVINNVDVLTEFDSSKIKSALIRQLYSPVRWSEIIQLIIREGVHTFLEIAPGNKVLSGFTKKIVKIPKPKIAIINDIASLKFAKSLID
ncbi:malonyl CoA-acyl carrier protein transacylase [Candidatus Photodesmus katoptron]|uniref:Malonyl CoA-acyl carrier protein transacylase n=1 Tax=Candidatus Photodesmus katoptron Akat1 TaxID=1236703 RepID=S3E0C4_9GAMM|nr:ACP S-malonyltransferase [Candidatus Photodesmus katoptron]EPE37646.1 malonyl coa-acyl carrier protein transacylase [Candidatus Photodesmus katoptron Akat1]KEY90634.1 malonyl CoA-acyl carrier protein transacylase [Candidatus Photodesmus katoptron]